MARRADTNQAHLERFAALCRQHGLSMTVQRRTILEAVLARKDHPTADQVYAAVRSRVPNISRTTVYRVLETLVGVGAITRICHPGAATRYDPLTHRHHHLVCVNCKQVIDFEDHRLNALPAPRQGGGRFQIHDYSVHFMGLCDRCQPKGASASAGGRKSNVKTSSRARAASASAKRRSRA